MTFEEALALKRPGGLITPYLQISEPQDSVRKAIRWNREKMAVRGKRATRLVRLVPPGGRITAPITAHHRAECP
jgi:hypothetical protein